MDARTHERTRAPVHGRLSPRPRSRNRAPAVALLALVVLALASAITGGLLRVGVVAPLAADAAWLPRAGLHHAALMLGAFMGTVIAIERAVALKLRWAWGVPLASGLAGVALLAGADAVAGALLALAGAGFVAVNAVLVRRQRAQHTFVLLGSAFAWAVGNLLFLQGGTSAAVIAWWFAFVVITIAAERLEMTRLTRRRPAAQVLLHALLVLLAVGAALTSWSAAAGGVLYGAALVLLAGWLLAFDIARRTVFAQGLPRYMAVCLLGGYGWLAVAGGAWAATALGLPLRDIALHALGLGFVVSMMMGHAPVILPAIAGVKLQFSRIFYLPLAVLHASLALRFGPGRADLPWRADGALLNVLAFVLFAATMLAAALAWRRRHGRASTT